MPKPLKVTSRKTGEYTTRRGKHSEYLRHDVTIPPDLMEKLHWQPGQELDFEIHGDKLTLWPKKNKK